MAIVITSQPYNQTTYRGESVYISVSATSNVGSSMLYNWYKRGSYYASGRSIQVDTSTTGTWSYYCRILEVDTGLSVESNTAMITVKATPTPVLSDKTSINSATYYRGAAAGGFAAFASTDKGTVTYQWQQSADGSTWSNISGATSSRYTPSTSSVGVKLYRVCATNTLSGYSQSVYSDAATITVNATPKPVLKNSSGVYDTNYYIGAAAATFDATATSAEGTISYLWEKSLTASSWQTVGTSATYTPPTSSVGTLYYRCTVTNKLNGYTAAVYSNVGQVEMRDTPYPVLNDQTNISSATYFQGDDATNFVVFASVEKGTITYQWQQSADGSTWSNISGATSSRYTPETNVIGETLYRVRVTNTLNGYSKNTYSDAATITVDNVPTPEFINSSTISNATYYRGQGASQMDATATVESGTLTYSWERTPFDSGTNWVQVATTLKYTPPTTTVGDYLYHCKVTNTLNGYKKTVYTNTPTISVRATPVPALADSGVNLANNTYPVGAIADTLSAPCEVAKGTLSYQWQKSTDGSSYTDLAGATKSSLTPSTIAPGVYYYRCVATNTLYGYKTTYTSPAAQITIVVNSTVTITQQPKGATYYRGARASALVCNASSSDDLALTYVWYNASGTQVGTGTSYTPPTSSVSSVGYYCVVTDENGARATSSTVYVRVLSTPNPYFSSGADITSASYSQGASAKALNGSANSESGTVTYQWQQSSNGTSFSNISGQTTASFTPSTNVVGTVYYRVVVTNSLYGYTTTITSDVATITVREITQPVITTQPVSAVYTLQENADALSVEVTPASSYAYRWQSSANASSWTNIQGATQSSYKPSTNLAGVTYYRVVVTNGTGTYAKTATSVAARITVQMPPVQITKQPLSADYGLNDIAKPLETAATANGTTISYNWQRSQDGETGWESITGASNQTYTPPTNNYSITYYRCVITASNNGQTETAITNTARIQVSTATPPVFLKPLVSASYEGNQEALPLDGTATAGSSTVVYQWYWSPDGENFYPISGAVKAKYTPSTAIEGTRYYYVIATAKYGTDSAFTRSNTATITVENVIYSAPIAWQKYLEALKTDFVKLARLEFLQPDGSVAFALDNNPMNKRSGAFLQEGTLTVNLQNGKRRTATVTLANLDGEYEYNVNKVWFGQQIRLSEGLVLPNGQEFYLPQGVFYLVNPEEKISPNSNTVTWTLDDKWAYLDGTLFGNLEGMYEVPVNTNIFTAVESVLKLDRGNGYMVDSVPPVFTDYYNAQTTTLPSGAVVSYVQSPYTARFESDDQTYADVVLEMNTMVAGWVGYDQTGRLRMDPSQDDILDVSKPIQWAFTPTEKQFLGATYTVKNSEVYNDIIVTGEGLDEYENVSGRATNFDPASDTNVNLIGKKVLRISSPGYASDKQCENLAVFKLKRQTVLQKSVSIESAQIFHLQENQLVTIQRPDKPGQPVERHLVTGFTRPIAQKGNMQIEATSANDFPVATVNEMPWEE